VSVFQRSNHFYFEIEELSESVVELCSLSKLCSCLWVYLSGDEKDFMS
jgi:hypothetical protein